VKMERRDNNALHRTAARLCGFSMHWMIRTLDVLPAPAPGGGR